MVVEGALRGVSELCIFFPQQKVILAPNHHFDFPFFTHELYNQKNILNNLLTKYINLKYYEKQVY